MNKFQWQDGLMEKIESLCAIFPPVIKNRWRDRLMYNSEKIAAYNGSSQVTEDIFWRSVYEVFPGGYEPLILKIKDPEKLKALYKPYPADLMEMYPVSTQVNSPKNDSAELIKAVQDKE